MIKRLIFKSRGIVLVATVLLLSACAGGYNDKVQDEVLSPSKEQELHKTAPPVVNPSRKRGPEPSVQFKRKMLAAVNAARVGGYTCGNRKMPPVSAVVWSEQLQQAALAHSKSMADGNYFNHQDKAGNRVGERVYAVGYDWRAAGENIAAGQLDASDVVNGWLGSKGHCLNMMDGDYSQMGMASYSDKNTYYGIYWTQVLAAPL